MWRRRGPAAPARPLRSLLRRGARAWDGAAGRRRGPVGPTLGGVANRDIIVIGASAGGVEVLLDLAEELPAGLPASLFVVIHLPAGGASVMPELLSRRGPLPASHPVHGEAIAPARIYVAPPDAHLMVRRGSVGVVRGPKENGHRPAVDPLFRTASWAYGPRVIGVVLSGHQDCGTAGMMSVKARRGLAVVQDPSTAAAPEMPESVLRRVPVDHVVHPLELPGLLVRLSAEAVVEPEERGAPAGDIEVLEGARAGSPVELVCPACQGVLTEARPGEFEHFRCHVGHTFSLEALVREQSEEVERALWAAVRSLEESAALSRRLASRTADEDLRRRFLEKGATQLGQAGVIRKVLLEGASEFDEAARAGAEQPGAGNGSAS